MNEMIVLRPYWIFTLPVVAGLLFWRLRRAGRPGDWHAIIDPHLLEAMAGMGRVDVGGSRLPLVLPFLVAGSVGLALTGPAVERRSAQTFRNLDGVIFVIDLSGSVVRDESWPKLVNMARAGLSVLQDKPAALIVYAGDSYLATPLSTDHVQLGQTISLLDAETVPDRGNRPALALDRAAALLAAADILTGEVVLFTDGAGLDAAAYQAAQRIVEAGGRLSVVLSETSVSGEPLVDVMLIATLAHMGGGRVFRVDSLAPFMRAMRTAGADRLERQDLRLLFAVDYGRYLLLLALLPALLLFRRRMG